MARLSAPARFFGLAGLSLLLFAAAPWLTGRLQAEAAGLFLWPQRCCSRLALIGGPLARLWRRGEERDRLAGDIAALQERLGRAEAENQRLRRQLAQVRLFAQRLEEIGPAWPVAEPRRLTSEDLVLLNVAGREREAEIRVLGGDAGGWRGSLFLDRGADAGLRPGAPVLCGESVVGQIQAVGRWCSRLATVEDGAFAAAAEVARSGARGVVRGAGPGELLRLEFLGPARPPAAGDLPAPAVQAGDRVVTAAEFGLFPPGFLLGVVQQVRQGPNELAPTALLRPARSPLEVEAVVVLKRNGPLLPALPPGPEEN